MAAHLPAYQTYASTPAKSLKDTEIEIILETTRRLRNAARFRHEDFPQFAKSLQDNRKLWITLASDVANSGNPLPPDLRAKIFYLAEFTQNYTRKVLNEQLGIDPLIDINLAVMRGLSAERKTG